MANNKGVLVIYTGGTIGCIPSDPSDKESPLVVADWDTFKSKVSALRQLPFKVDAFSFDPPIDSTNMEPKFWRDMVEAIEKNYNSYEGFVILHGTDTMVYTASALSFMLVNLAKPVVITGSQLPIIGRSRNDGEQNLITALEIANPAYSNIPIVPEVCIFFRDKLLRGNRCVKVSASGYAGFDSPNYLPLGEAGEHIIINTNVIRPMPREGAKFYVNKNLDTNVMPLAIFPGIQSGDNTLMRQVLSLPNLKAMVLNTYGTGNAPTTPKFLEELGAATRKKNLQDETRHEITILDVSQCTQGMVEMGVYETSVALLDEGIVSGSDITTEAALCKLMVLLGDEDNTPEKVKEIVQTNLAGEQSRSIHTTKYPEEKVKLESSSGERSRYRIVGQDIGGNWQPDKIELAQLRLRIADLSSTHELKPIKILVFMNLSGNDPLDQSKPNFVGVFNRRVKQISSTLIFDVTKTVKGMLQRSMKLSFTIALLVEGKEELYTDLHHEVEKQFRIQLEKELEQSLKEVESEEAKRLLEKERRVKLENQLQSKVDSELGKLLQEELNETLSWESADFVLYAKE